MHTPALLKEAVESLNVTSGDKFIDATFGEGGYSQEILRRGGKVLAIDLDRDQIQNLKSKMPNLKLFQGNFANVEEIAKEKMKDLNADTIEAAMNIVRGTARSMGVETE